MFADDTTLTVSGVHEWAHATFWSCRSAKIYSISAAVKKPNNIFDSINTILRLQILKCHKRNSVNVVLTYAIIPLPINVKAVNVAVNKNRKTKQNQLNQRPYVA